MVDKPLVWRGAQEVAVKNIPSVCSQKDCHWALFAIITPSFSNLDVSWASHGKEDRMGERHTYADGMALFFSFLCSSCCPYVNTRCQTIQLLYLVGQKLSSLLSSVCVFLYSAPLGNVIHRNRSFCLTNLGSNLNSTSH